MKKTEPGGNAYRALLIIGGCHAIQCNISNYQQELLHLQVVAIFLETFLIVMQAPPFFREILRKDA